MTYSNKEKWWAEQIKYYDIPDCKLIVGRRTYLGEVISGYKPDSVLELGCGAGRNMKYINANVKVGIDCNEYAIDMANQIQDAKFIVGSIFNTELEDKFDIVFTSGVMMHQNFDAVKLVVEECKRLATKYIIHAEWHGANRVASTDSDGNPHAFVHNFNKLYEKPQITKLPIQMGGANQLVVVKT